MAKSVLVETLGQRALRRFVVLMIILSIPAAIIFLLRMFIENYGIVTVLLVPCAVISLWLVLRYKGYQRRLRAAYAKYDHLFLDAPNPAGVANMIYQCEAEIIELTDGGIGEEDIRKHLLVGDESAKFDRAVVLACFEHAVALPKKKSMLLRLFGAYKKLDKQVLKDWRSNWIEQADAPAPSQASALRNEPMAESDNPPVDDNLRNEIKGIGEDLRELVQTGEQGAERIRKWRERIDQAEREEQAGERTGVDEIKALLDSNEPEPLTEEQAAAARKSAAPLLEELARRQKAKKRSG